MIELKALNLHWLENIRAEEDLCAHGSVYLKLENKVVSEKTPDDWTVSASAYYLLKTIKENHTENSTNQLIPHCGTIWGINNEIESEILGCNYGLNWTVSHTENKVIHQFDDGEVIKTDLNEWRNAVCKFSDEVTNFYRISLPKLFEDEEDKKAFEFFMNQWKKLRAEAFD